MADASGVDRKKPADMREYRQGERIGMTAQFEDETGVGHVRAVYYRAKEPGTREMANVSEVVELSGYGGGQKRVTVTLVGPHVTNQVPGEYFCTALEARDTLDNISNQNNPESAPRFRITAEGRKDREGPKFLGFGNFQ